MKHLRRYTFKLYPNAQQVEALERQAALCGQLWNAALEQREAQWRHECIRKGKGERKGLGKFDQSKELKFVRADDPEYAAMGADSLALVLDALDQAFKAFYRRAKQGAGASSGYPQYKSTYIGNPYRHGTIWHRDHRKGWRLEKRTKKGFAVYAKGIPGLIKARGKFPVAMEDLEIRDMRLIRDGAKWLCSIVIRLDASRKAGDNQTSITMNLIDEFARVEMSNDGQCVSGDEAFFETRRREFTSKSGGYLGTSSGDPEIVGEPQDGIRLRQVTKPRDTLEDTGGTLGVGQHVASPDNKITGKTQVRKVSSSAEVSKLIATQQQIDQLLSDCDTRHTKFSYRWKQKRRRVAKLQGKLSRQRKEFLHRWTTWIVSQSRSIDLTMPDLTKHVRTARGNEKFHGAAVKTVAELNRRILSQCPGAARAMLEYKADAASILINVTVDENPPIAVGHALSEQRKATRRASRHVRKSHKAMKEMTNGPSNC